MKEFIKELKIIHKKFSRFEFLLVILFLLLVLFIPHQPNIIGFSDINIHKQSINLALDQSKSFLIQTQVPALVTSFSVSGEVLGPGAAKIYIIDDKGKKHEVFSNEQKGMHLITGFYGEDKVKAESMKTQDPILQIVEGQKINFAETVNNAVPGEFITKCSDSCILEPSNSLELQAYVEPGTTLIITELDYTTVNK